MEHPAPVDAAGFAYTCSEATDPLAWAAKLDDYEAQQRRARTVAEVRAGFLRHAVATCGLPFSDGAA